MDIHPDWKEFLSLLNSKSVDYLVIGAHALAYHGHPRMTSDLDCFVGIADRNIDSLLSVLIEFGFREGLPSRQDLQTNKRVLMLGRAPFRIDILNEISGVKFDEAWTHRIAGELGGVPVNFISREDYLTNKRQAGRAKDRADLEALDEA